MFLFHTQIANFTFQIEVKNKNRNSVSSIRLIDNEHANQLYQLVSYGLQQVRNLPYESELVQLPRSNSVNMFIHQSLQPGDSRSWESPKEADTV